MKHTPAPWSIRQREADDLNLTHCYVDAESQNLSVARILAGKGSRSVEEATANARLIAAAPDLLETLQNLLNVTEPTARPSKGDLKVNRENGFKAIAKATGQ